MVLLGLLYPLGSIVQGALADTFGLRAVTAAAAVLLAVVLLAVRVLRRGFDRQLDDVTPRPASLAVVGAVAPGGASRAVRRQRRGALGARRAPPARAARRRAGPRRPGGPASRGPRRPHDAASTAGPPNGASASTARRRTAGMSSHAATIAGRPTPSGAERRDRGLPRQRVGVMGRPRREGPHGVPVGVAELAERPRRRFHDGDVLVVEQVVSAATGAGRPARRCQLCGAAPDARVLIRVADCQGSPAQFGGRRGRRTTAAARARASGSPVTAAVRRAASSGESGPWCPSAA